MGTPEMMEVRNKLLVDKLGVAIVSVDYRLAPEYAHPIPVEDCYAGYQWTLANAEARGFDASRIVSMGESAGGGLAAALGLLLRDRGDRSLLGQYLIYPMLDDRTASSVEPAAPVGEFIWTRASNRFGWGALLGHEPGGEDVSPYAAPARASDLSGLPTTFMYTGALDLFMEEDIEYAKRLMCAGVPTELHVYPGAIHAFEMLLAGPIAEQASADILRSLRALLRL
jgi:acetyl esterase/lipase